MVSLNDKCHVERRNEFEFTMKRIFRGSVLLLAAFGFSARLSSAEDLPKSFEIARYQGMMEHSPFAVATKVVAPEEKASFAKDLYIANAARSKEGDMVTVASSTDKNFKKYLTSGMTQDGYSITNIEWSDKVGATKVTITKDGQSATLGFNEALLRQPGQGPPGTGQPPAPPPVYQPPQDNKDKQAAQPPTSGALVPAASQPTTAKPMPVPMVPTPQPKVRGTIPRNP